MRTTYEAIWGKKLIISSVIATSLCVGVATYLARLEPLKALLPLAVITGAVPFLIRGYVLDERGIGVRRLWWTTRISLADLVSVEAIPDAMKGSLRLCGNGGMFSYTGWFRSSRLRNFRAFVTDDKNSVVLRFPERTIVLSPALPDEFVKAVKAALPDG